ncbi:hemicentin-1, partial [Biomphalaria pfeifferi]
VSYFVRWFNGSTVLMGATTLLLANLDLTVHEITSEIQTYNYKSGTGLRFTFCFEATSAFGLNVALLDSTRSGAFITAMPVEAWGKNYFVLTLNATPSIQISTEFSNKLSISLRITGDASMGVEYNGNTYVNETLEVFLSAYQSFELSECKRKSFRGALTGTYITSTSPIGIISGNCEAGVTTEACGTEEAATEMSKDIAADMMLPTESYGKHFFLFAVRDSSTPRMYLVLAKLAKTKMTLTCNGKIRRYNTRKPGMTREMTVAEHLNCLLYATLPVMVVQAQMSTCSNSDKRQRGDPSLSLIVPFELFYYFYTWSTPKNVDENFKSYVVLIVLQAHTGSILVDDLLVEEPTLKCGDVQKLGEKRRKWQACEIPVGGALHNAKVEKQYYFGCYIYGVSSEFGYMSPAGAIISSIYNKKCESTITIAVIDDLIDNDCDGTVDEELEDGLDNDNDSLVDEDLGVTIDNKVIEYQLWQELSTKNFTNCRAHRWGYKCKRRCDNCLDDCSKEKGSCHVCKAGFKDGSTGCNQKCGPNEYGEGCSRKCDIKCDGDDCYERVFGECKKCRPNHWGLHCLQTCPNCKDDCDKSYGTCSECNGGFKHPQYGCNTPCQTNEYGENCARNCTAKCRHDCFERIYGMCSENDQAPWSRWQCSRSCSDSNQYRKRLCNQNDTHLHDCAVGQNRTSDCYVHKKCPLECPQYSWGPDCENSCINCISDCDKFNGSCDKCRRGYDNPNMSCSKADGKFSGWSSWKCIRECESEEQSRQRFCNNPPPSSGGKDCIGKAVDIKKEKCFVGIDCNDGTRSPRSYGQFSEWSDWVCVKDCESLEEIRERICLSEGLQCIGNMSELRTKICNIGIPCLEDRSQRSSSNLKYGMVIFFLALSAIVLLLCLRKLTSEINIAMNNESYDKKLLPGISESYV